MSDQPPVIIDPFGCLKSYLTHFPREYLHTVLLQLLESIEYLPVAFLGPCMDEHASRTGLSRVLGVRFKSRAGGVYAGDYEKQLSFYYEAYKPVHFGDLNECIVGRYDGDSVVYSVGPLMDDSGTPVTARVTHRGSHGRVEFCAEGSRRNRKDLPTLSY